MRNSYGIEGHPHSRTNIEAQTRKKEAEILAGINSLFNLSWTNWTLDGWSTEHKTDLTVEEMNDVRLFLRYASKRLLKAALHAPLFGYQETVGLEQATQEALSAHELAHAIVAYSRKRENSVVPEFMRTGDLYTHDILEEEFAANLWGGIIGYRFSDLAVQDRRERILYRMRQKIALPYIHPAEKMLFQGILKTKTWDLEAILKAHEDHMIIAIVNTNSTYEKGFDENRSYQKSFHAAKAIRQNRSSYYTESARRVAENIGNDPKALFHEFQRVCDPLLSRLRKNNERLAA